MTHGSPSAWNERDHPRNPEDGKFVDRVGSGGWAQRISDSISQSRSGGRDSIIDDLVGGPGGNVESHPRREYNDQILDEANAAEGENRAEGDSDAELVAQMRSIDELKRRGDLAGWDSAVDHLRGMLTISYLDDEDLPGPPDSNRDDPNAQDVSIDVLAEMEDEDDGFSQFEFWDEVLGYWRAGHQAMIENGKLVITDDDGENPTHVTGGVTYRAALTGPDYN
jgi:hypothetical protein